MRGEIMALTKVQFVTLVQKAINGGLSADEDKALQKELCKRFENNTYESYLERILVAGYALYGDSAKRSDYIRLAIERWQKKIHP